MGARAAVAAPGQAGGQGRGAPAATDKPVKKVHWTDGKRPEKTPLFSGIVSYGNLVFISGIGAHFEGDIKAHTDHVLEGDPEEAGGRRARRWRRS